MVGLRSRRRPSGNASTADAVGYRSNAIAAILAAGSHETPRDHGFAGDRTRSLLERTLGIKLL
jgi:L-aminopeptidase/D-esterase-like protein